MTMIDASTDSTSVTPPPDGAPPARPSWQTEPCPDWCRWAPHSEAEHPTDRNHAGTSLHRRLSLEQPTSYPAGPGQEDTWESEHAQVYLWQHYRETEPRIHMRKGEGCEGFDLTLEDAEVLAEALQGAATEGRAGARPARVSQPSPSWAGTTSTDTEGWSYWSSEGWCFPEGRMQVIAATGPSGQEGPSVQLDANFERPLTPKQAREVARQLLEHADRADRG